MDGRHDVRLGLLGKPAQQRAEAPPNALLPRRRRRVVRHRRGPVGQRRGRLGQAEVGRVAAAAHAAEDGVAEEDGAAAAPRLPASKRGKMNLLHFNKIH